MIQAPTPLEPAPRLASAIGLERLLIKREDLSGFGLGGNKPRQLEVILADALEHGADTVVTTASAQSSFCRATAAAAAHLGLRCVLLLRGAPVPDPQGNLLLDTVFGAELEFIDTDDAYDPEVEERLATIASAARKRGGRPYVIHLPGRTGALAAAAAVSVVPELRQQLAPSGGGRYIYGAVGSGLTLVGLALGLEHLRVAARVVGISVQQPESFLKPLLLRRAGEAAELLGIETRLDGADFDLDDRYIGPGYGKPSQAGLDALALAGRVAGLVLDPSYTGKALAGLIAHAREGRIPADAEVVFIHTGGEPNLFANNAAVSRHLLARRRAGEDAPVAGSQ